QRRFALSWPTALLDVDLAPSRLRLATLAGVACLGVILGLFAPDVDARDAHFVVASSAEPDLAAVFEPEPLTGVRPWRWRHPSLRGLTAARAGSCWSRLPSTCSSSGRPARW